VTALYLDEDLSRYQLVGALRSRGFDVLTSFEAGMNGQNDDSQLAFAAAHRRQFVTANAGDFARLHGEWIRQGRMHAGVIVVPQQRYSTGEIVRRLLRFAARAVEGTSELYYLSNF
jgi:hypothetical protein